MGWEAWLIEALQAISNTFLDYLIFGLTYLGDKLFFVVVLCIIYWCFSKKFAFRFLNVYIAGAGANDAFKRIVRRPRPFQKYNSIRAIIHETSGFSFPSGHSRSIASIATQITQKTRKHQKFASPVLIVSIAATAIVLFSRMYLGQHYLTDVLCGAMFGMAMALVFDRLYNYVEAFEYKFYMIMVPISVILTIVLLSTGLHADLSSVIEGAAAYSAAALGYALENKYVAYEPSKSSKPKQLAKIAIGMAVAILIILLATAIKAITVQASIQQTILASYLPYTIVGLWVFLAAPATFKKLNL